MKLVEILNALIYCGPTTIDELARKMQVSKVKMKDAIIKLANIGLIEKIDEKHIDASMKVLNTIVQRRVKRKDLLEIIGRRKPEFMNHLKLLGKLNELYQELIGEKAIPQFKFLKLPSERELEIGEKPLEEAIADALLSILADLVFNIPITDVDKLIEVLNEAKGEARNIAIEMLRRFYMDVSREYNLLKRVLEAVG
ncbi:MAG: hypothetical protein NDF55_05915 [archaeon GB-1867-005]|nr:hypothetical protein [Candidatus Culexmicrobium cathedralense]